MVAEAAGERRPRVLIWEDSREYLELERHLLETAGYHVDWVSDGKAVEAVRTTRPALLILGVTSRGRRLEVAGDLGCNPVTRDADILITGIRGHITRQQIVAGGADAVLWKPLSPERLVAQVEELTQHSDGRDRRMGSSVATNAPEGALSNGDHMPKRTTTNMRSVAAGSRIAYAVFGNSHHRVACSTGQPPPRGTRPVPRKIIDSIIMR